MPAQVVGCEQASRSRHNVSRVRRLAPMQEMASMARVQVVAGWCRLYGLRASSGAER